MISVVIFTERGPIRIKRKIDVCEQELNVTDIYISFSKKKKLPYRTINP